MLTPTKIQVALQREGIHRNLVDVATALSGIDQVALLSAERERYRVEIWDKTTALNGVSAEIFLERTDVGEGEVYLIYKDNVLQYFQPHDPNHEGFVPMSPMDVLGIGSTHADRCAEGHVAQQILNLIKQSLAPGISEL